jgi:hypothetical protein
MRMSLDWRRYSRSGSGPRIPEWAHSLDEFIPSAAREIVPSETRNLRMVFPPSSEN